MPFFDRLGNDMNDSASEADAQAEDARRDASNPTREEWDAYTAEEEAKDAAMCDELTGEAEHDRDSDPFGYGDPRRCHRHPEVRTSSDDGMFDAPCGRCESESDEHCDWSEWKEELVASGPTCADIFTPWNPTRSCRTDGAQLCYMSQAQVPAEDEIPF